MRSKSSTKYLRSKCTVHKKWTVQIEADKKTSLCNSRALFLNLTRRERVKSALYLRLKKRKTFFCGKLEIFEFFFRKMSHSAKKCKRGDPF